MSNHPPHPPNKPLQGTLDTVASFRRYQVQTFGYLLSVLSGLLFASAITFVVTSFLIDSAFNNNDPEMMCLGCLGGCMLATFAVICIGTSQVMVLTIAVISMVFWFTTDGRNHRISVYGIAIFSFLGLIATVTAILTSSNEDSVAGENVTQAIFFGSQMLLFLFVLPMAFWINGWQESVRLYGIPNIQWIMSSLVGLSYLLIGASIAIGLTGEQGVDRFSFIGIVAFSIGVSIYASSMFLLAYTCFRFAGQLRTHPA